MEGAAAAIVDQLFHQLVAISFAGVIRVQINGRFDSGAVCFLHFPFVRITLTDYFPVFFIDPCRVMFDDGG